MPASPPIIFAPPAAGAAPTAPVIVFQPPAAGAAPTAPGIVFVPPAAGAAPTAPVIVFQPAAAPVNQIKMTGGSFLNSDERIFNPQAPSYEAGFTTYTAFDSSIYHYAGKWVISFGEDYTAEISSTAASPVGLTGWTILTGIGNPTIVELFVA